MSNKQSLLRTFSYVKPYKYAFWIGAFLYMSQGFIMSIMNSVLLGGTTSAILESNLSGIIDTIILTAIILVGSYVLIGIGIYLYAVREAYAIRDMSIDVFRAFTKSSMESQKHSGEGIAALNTDVKTASGIFGTALFTFSMSVITASFSVVAVFVIDWRMGLGALAIGGLIFLAQSRLAGPLARLGKKQLEANADSVKSLSNILAGALAIRVFNRQERALVQFDRESGKLKKLAFKEAFIGMWQSLITSVQGWLTLVVAFALGGWLVVIGEIDFAMIMMVLPFMQAIGMSISQVGTAYAGFHPPIVAARRVFEVIDSAPPQPQDDITIKCDEWSGDYSIEVKHLSFSYKGATEETSTEALKGIDLSIEENKMIAFVGESGSGKSTILRVITGMHERDDIDMKLGELPFTAENIGEWRSHFAYVDQSCKLFDMTIAENIAMGTLGKASEEQIIEAAKRAFAHDFISELPDGYATSCGEKGASLSGGQKQRIAIARALCRKAPVLVFDEATSALDPSTERSIMETIENLRHDHTVLITTHHLSNIATADKIVVLDNGIIAESGTHAELVEKGGLYLKLLKEGNAVS